MTFSGTSQRFLVLIFIIVAVLLGCEAATDQNDVIALQDMYKAMNKPEQLKGWQAEGGDPCEQSWTGVECSNSSVIHIKLRGLELAGTLGSQLANLHSLKHMDLSINSIEREIPFDLPPNVTYLNLASNKFLLGIPHSVSTLVHLRHLNLSHNLLSGPLGSVFDGLQNLKEMDLSYNKFSGDLPSSFASLKNLSSLYLQGNEFTGSVVYLSDLHLTDLNIQDNHFSGIIPLHFQTIPNLWMAGNKFDKVGTSPPWNFPYENFPNEQNFTSPPTAESSAIEKNPSHQSQQHKPKKISPGAVVFFVGGFAFVITFLAVAFFVYFRRARTAKGEDSSNRSMYSIPVSSSGETVSDRHEELPPLSKDDPLNFIMPRTLRGELSPFVPPYLQHVHDKPGRRSFSRTGKMPPNAKCFTTEELDSATNHFSEENLLGEGSLGSVFKARFQDGQILCVKKIDTVSLSLHEEEQFMDVVRSISLIRHPCIVTLVGYCLERGQHQLVYEYVRDLTLDKALHGGCFIPLNWSVRIHIAVGVAQALEYMHSLSPPLAHCNLKAANILLDGELLPRISDCGLTVLRPLTSNNVKLKASEMAISDSGYIAPEHAEHGVESTKSDVYAFGVLLLELLTGKKPFDSSRPIEEQSLPKWASGQLHDEGSLKDMIDPILRRSITLKAISRYADVVSLCLQPVKEFRPPISEILRALMRMAKLALDGAESDFYERSFRSTHTRFLGSPSASLISADIAVR